MTEVTDADLGKEKWCTTEQVRDRFQLEIGNQEPDFEGRIVEATDAIQADWAEATGKAIPDDLPADVPDLLQYATAYEAASQAHLHFAQNISGDNDGDQRHVFLSRKSESMFDRWKKQADLDPGSEQSGDASDTVTGQSGVIGGEDRSPIDRGGF